MNAAAAFDDAVTKATLDKTHANEVAMDSFVMMV